MTDYLPQPRTLTAADVAAMNRDVLVEQYGLLADALRADNGRRLLHCIRQVLTDEPVIRDQLDGDLDEQDQYGPAPTSGCGRVARVVFNAGYWDNGYFYDGTGVKVYPVDGRPVLHVDFIGTPVEELLTDLSADVALGQNSQLVVDLLAGTVTHNG